MTSQNVLAIGLAVLVLGWIIYRQTQWQTLDRTRIWRGPIILAVIGAVSMRSSLTGGPLGTTAVALLVLEAVLSLSVGVGMGMLSQLRSVDGALAARTGLIGSLLWFVMIALRVGVGVWATVDGAKVVASTGVILLMLALNRAGRSAVLMRRADQLVAVRAH